MRVSLVTRRIEDNWEAVILSDGKFYRAQVGKDLFKMITTHLMAFLKSERPNDTEVAIDLTITEPQKDADPVE